MAKMVGICLESPLGGSPNLNTILLDPLQNVSTSWELDPSPPDSTRATGRLSTSRACTVDDRRRLPRSIGLNPLENKFYHQARTEAEQRMVMRNDLRNDLRDGGRNGTTPAQPPVHRAQMINTMKINPSSKSRWKLIIIECNVRSPYVFLTLKPPTYYYCIAHFSFQYYTYDTHSIVPFSFFFFSFSLAPMSISHELV